MELGARLGGAQKVRCLTCPGAKAFWATFPHTRGGVGVLAHCGVVVPAHGQWRAWSAVRADHRGLELQ